MFLHVGTGKTGTSAVQSCLAANEGGLRQRGILYPSHEMLAVPGGDLPSSGNGGPLLHYVFPEVGPLNESEFLEKFAGILAGPEHTIVISNEMLEYGHAQKFMDLRDFCTARGSEIKIVYFVRDIAAHAFSAWRWLATNHGHTENWVEFQRYYAAEVNVFESTLRKFTDIFSRENVMVTNYSSLGRRTTEWFLSILGEDYSAYKAAEEVNRSVSLQTVALMLEFNRCLKDILEGSTDQPVLREPFYAAVLGRVGPGEAREPDVSLEAQEYEILREKFERSLDWINTVYLPSDPIQIARPNQIGLPLQVPKLSLSGRQAVRRATELIIANSNGMTDQNGSLAARLDEILGPIHLFAEN